jgi:hypothetical protein
MSKFKVGDKVHCYREETAGMMGFDFTGNVLKVCGTYDDVEYIVSNAPLIFAGIPLRLWESEMSPCEE